MPRSAHRRLAVGRDQGARGGAPGHLAARRPRQRDPLQHRATAPSTASTSATATPTRTSRPTPTCTTTDHRRGRRRARDRERRGHQLRAAGATGSTRVYSGMSIAPDLERARVRALQHLHATPSAAASSSRSAAPARRGSCTTRSPARCRGAPAVHPSGPYSNMHFRNNILVGNGRRGERRRGRERDRERLRRRPAVRATIAALFRWKGVNYATLAALRTRDRLRAERPQPAIRCSSRRGDRRLLAAGGQPRDRRGAPLAGDQRPLRRRRARHGRVRVLDQRDRTPSARRRSPTCASAARHASSPPQRPLLRALDQHRDALAAADAGRGDAVALAALAQLDQQRVDEPRAGRAERVAERRSRRR